MDFVNELIDKTPYVWWVDGESTTQKEAPFYCKNIPDIEIIQSLGCNCAGLINLLQLSRGLAVPGVKTDMFYAGGTYVWFDYLNDIGALTKIDINKEYPKGTMLIRKYRSPEDQGHLAVLYTTGKFLEQKLLHCYPGAGIRIDDTAAESHNWIEEGYYEYVCINWLHSDLPSPSF